MAFPRCRPIRKAGETVHHSGDLRGTVNRNKNATRTAGIHVDFVDIATSLSGDASLLSFPITAFNSAPKSRKRSSQR